MSTLAMVWRNLFGRGMTVRFPAAPGPQAGYRGLVEYDAARCTGCSLCAFRCSSQAIRFRGTRTEIKWSYDAAQCTFCGRCIDGCAAGALKMAEECPPVYFAAGALKTAYATARVPPAKKTVSKTVPGETVPAAATGGTQ